MLIAYLQVNTMAPEPSPAVDWNHKEASTQVLGAGQAWRNTSPSGPKGIAYNTAAEEKRTEISWIGN